MFSRHRRILWLLNHKTLRPFEVNLLVELGYEVFTPKVIPTEGNFRSGTVDFSHDPTLTIPRWVLERLNRFDFYNEVWRPDIVALVNRYFGTVFFMPHGCQVREVLEKFEGQLMFRAFGLDAKNRYIICLRHNYEDAVRRIVLAGERFWFAQGYLQLAEVEPPLLADRAVYLPIGLPSTFTDQWANSYQGGDRRILFVCPNCVTNPYYRQIHLQFKQDFGDLPHVIIGQQDVPVDDPNVLSYVSDADLIKLYQSCALLYYHSKEPRHVHYSPIEAAVVGMPVVYYADSLLGQSAPDIKLGRCHNLEEVHETARRILSGDQDYVAALRLDQRKMSEKFSDTYCHAIWKKNLLESGFSARLKPESRTRRCWEEIKRTLLRPFAHGLSRLPARDLGPHPPKRSWLALPPEFSNGDTLATGIDFTKADYPWFVTDIVGLSFPEPAGRWSTGRKITITLEETLPSRLDLVIEGGAYSSSQRASIKVQVGHQKKSFSFARDPGQGEEVTLSFAPGNGVRIIEIAVPKPVRPPGDDRQISIALKRIRFL